MLVILYFIQHNFKWHISSHVFRISCGETKNMGIFLDYYWCKDDKADGIFSISWFEFKQSFWERAVYFTISLLVDVYVSIESLEQFDATVAPEKIEKSKLIVWTLSQETFMRALSFFTTTFYEKRKIGFGWKGVFLELFLIFNSSILCQRVVTQNLPGDSSELSVKIEF